ncbi:hypothetical protein A0H81_08672 [Grifola frondosa]|uniref:Uncharacterized protein n=1 Tax=Grifola frondosa TaxID=5627 RepID=A0A1C7M5E5_GRIFR|nr:hypothetical protein A0H81_08672 [Grifola frondosa]
MKLKGVFDTVLSTAVGLRQLAAQQSYGNACPTTPLWYSLMKAIGMASFEGAHILSEVPSILPRMSPCEASEQHKFDGIATMLTTPSYARQAAMSSLIAPKFAIQSATLSLLMPVLASQGATSRWNIAGGSNELDAASQQVESHSEEDQVKSSAHDSDVDISVDGKLSVEESDDNVSMEDESSAGESDEDISVDDESSTNDLQEMIYVYDESESTSESSIALSIRIPFGAHMLPRTGRRYSPILQC